MSYVNEGQVHHGLRCTNVKDHGKHSIHLRQNNIPNIQLNSGTSNKKYNGWKVSLILNLNMHYVHLYLCTSITYTYISIGST